MAQDPEINYFEEGKKAARQYYKSQAFSSLSENITAELAIRIILPPLEEALTQMATPLPKSRQKWIAGFKKEQKEILAEYEIFCKECGHPLPKKENL